MSRISIAMTTYCGEKYIVKQLESLLWQTVPADEIVILDDCSKDRTAELVRAFIAENKLKHWRFEVNAENLGFIRNFHKAISMTTGDIVFLCDQDDVWQSDKLERVAAVFEKEPEAMAVNTGFGFIDGEGVSQQPYERPGTANHNLIFRAAEPDECFEISEREIIKGNISPGCTMAFSAALRTIYLAQSPMLLPHDFELNILAAKHGKLLFLNTALTEYRVHGSNVIGLNAKEKSVSTTYSASEQARLNTLLGQETEIEYFQKHYNSDDVQIKTYLAHYARFVSARRSCLVRHNPFAALRMLKDVRYLGPNKTKRIVFGDLLYALHLQKFFKG